MNPCCVSSRNRSSWTFAFSGIGASLERIAVAPLASFTQHLLVDLEGG